MRIPGSPEEVSTEIGRATPHFITDFYASAHFKLTPEKFINRCDKCFISLPGCNKMSLEGKLTLHFHTMPFTLSLALQLSTLMLLHYHCTNALDTCTSALYNCSLCMLCTQFYRCTNVFCPCSVQNRTDVRMFSMHALNGCSVYTYRIAGNFGEH